MNDHQRKMRRKQKKRAGYSDGGPVRGSPAIREIREEDVPEREFSTEIGEMHRQQRGAARIPSPGIEEFFANPEFGKRRGPNPREKFLPKRRMRLASEKET